MPAAAGQSFVRRGDLPLEVSGQPGPRHELPDPIAPSNEIGHVTLADAAQGVADGRGEPVGLEEVTIAVRRDGEAVGHVDAERDKLAKQLAE